MIVFMYHSIQKENKSKSPFIVSEDIFKQQIDYINKKYSIIDIRDFEENLYNPKAALITFDDGYQDNYTIAYQYLKSQNIPCTIFLASKFVNHKMKLNQTNLPFLTTEMIQEMFESGLVYFGSHTHSHIRCDLSDKDTIIEDIQENIAYIKNLLGYQSEYFCYPQNMINTNIFDFIGKNFKFAFRGAGIVEKEINKLMINRIELTDNIPWFKMLYSYYKLRNLYWKLKGKQ